MAEIDDSIIISSDEESPPSKIRKLDVNKLIGNATTCHFQKLPNTGVRSQKEKDDIIYLDEEESNEIKEHYKLLEKNNKLSTKIVLTAKNNNKCLSSESDEKYEKNSNELNKENNVESKDILTIKDDIISSDEDKSKLKEINENYNMPEKNYKLTPIELTTVKDNNKSLSSCSEIDEKYEENSNELNEESNVENKDIITIKDDIISPDEDESKSNEINENYNMLEKNNILTRIELTTVKDNNKSLSSCSEIDEKCEENSNEFNKENNVESKDILTNKDEATKIIVSQEFEDFLEVCTSCECDIKCKSMILKALPKIKRKYNDAYEKFVNSETFKELLISKTKRIQQKPKNAVLIFNEIYRELEAKKNKKIELTDQEERHLIKLNTLFKKVHKKVKKLESEEVDFDEENNSSYIMLERYKERLCTIQEEICSYTKENFYAGRYLFRSLDFNSSKHSEINRSIDKLYSKMKQFPSFYEVNKCIRKCVTNNNINLPEEDLAKEIRSVYKDLGNILQTRRKTELYETLSYFLYGSEDDPADQDPELEALLHKRQEENDKKITEVLQKFSKCQERGEGSKESSLSSDSDDSHHVSDSDDYDS